MFFFNFPVIHIVRRSALSHLQTVKAQITLYVCASWAQLFKI